MAVVFLSSGVLDYFKPFKHTYTEMLMSSTTLRTVDDEPAVKLLLCLAQLRKTRDFLVVFFAVAFRDTLGSCLIYNKNSTFLFFLFAELFIGTYTTHTYVHVYPVLV